MDIDGLILGAVMSNSTTYKVGIGLEIRKVFVRFPFHKIETFVAPSVFPVQRRLPHK